jgi:Family of unknown function (DUF6065)
MSDSPGERPLVAYHVSASTRLEIAPAPIARDWMAMTANGFANRCLPLLVANQAGWWVISPQTLRVVWAGGAQLDDVSVELEDGAPPLCAASHFGHGIVTFTIPYLFRTPPGWNLLVRGPANLPKDGACALEGIVETDWCPATFTMNWKLTRPTLEVRFHRGDPIAMILPVRRGELESFTPEVKRLDAERSVSEGYREWRRSREAFLADLKIPGSSAQDELWQKDYMQGRRADGTSAGEHQRKLSLRPFRGG